ncbi:putative transcriptional regulator SLK2 [Iris pallida]|uniref:Transcriptional regulator SLK2 n=1 Tax=Iris pallida TaxID=29817 RepID=A0AAX6HJC0_IRIPA|nr:putative transcriptional regulator SLK2 [Iris pallida]KAJ6840624.1 putative transcriptional regulator SLK2 [Iris pallida]
MSGTPWSGLGLVSGEMNHGTLNSTANSSGPSIGASSLVTDANSPLSGGPHMQRSTSFNNESYVRLPASPMSFSSNNISCSSMMDGSSIVQQGPHPEQVKQGAFISSSIHPMIKQEPGMNLMHALKKPRLDPRQDDILQQQVIHHLLQRQRQEALQLQGHHSPQLNAIIQQHRLAQQRQQQQQQIVQSLPHMLRDPMPQQLRPNHIHVQAAPPVRHPSDSGICARRLMQYMYHQRHRPADNSILYWRKFVTEYFAPRAKKKWCYNVASHALGAFPQAAMDVWHCDICGSKSGKGFEAAYEVLPRLNQIKFDSGVVDELLFLEVPREFRFSSGIMVLEYTKAVQESVYEKLRVVREGHLRITFTPDLKILSWEFCARRHEEFLSRRVVAPQVNQLLQVANKYQTAVNESGSVGLPIQDLQASWNMFTSAGCQLARSLELHSLNDLGFSKRFVRCLQISEVVNSMKELIDVNMGNKIRPLESLKSYSRQAQAAAKFQAQKIHDAEQIMTIQSLSADQNSLNRTTGVNTGLGSYAINGRTPNLIVNSVPPSPAALNNYQYLLRTSNQNLNPLQLSSFSGANLPQPGPFLTKVPSFNGSVPPTPQQSQPANSFPHHNNNPHASPVDPNLEQRVIQQLLQEMINNSKGTGTPQQIPAAPHANVNVAAEMVGSGLTGSGGLPAMSSSVLVKGTTASIPSRSNSFKSAVNNHSSSSSNSFNGKMDLPPNLHLPELDQDIWPELTESGMQL